jgi:putative hydrolase of the HAD superfamily
MIYDTILFDLSSTLINYRGLVVGWEAMERLGFTAVHDVLLQSSDAKELPTADLWHSTAFARLREAWTDTLAGRRNLHLQDLLRDALAGQGVFPDDALIQAAVERYCAAISMGASAMPGGVELLRTLKEQGRQIGLISNTMWPGALHHADLVRFGLAEYIDIEIYSADANLWKPSAAVFLHALKRLGGSPDHAFFVGDNPNDDIVGAHNAGMKAVWIVNREYHREAGKDADAIIEQLPDLLEVLQRWEQE